eukprot:5877375-Pleurochrysis_carterae.AAC.1
MACLRVRGSVDAAQAAKAHLVLRPHFGLSQRARVAKSAPPPRDHSGYGPNARVKCRRESSVWRSELSATGTGRFTGGSGGGLGGVVAAAVVGGTVGVAFGNCRVSGG